MKKIILIFLLFLATACTSEEQPKDAVTAPKTTSVLQTAPPFQSISPSQAMQLIGAQPDLLILDTRTAREISQYGAIPNSVPADIRQIVQEGLAIPKTQPILVVCAIGGRSYGMGKFLVKQGHREIYNLSGGLDRWKREGMPVVFPEQ